MGGAVIIKHQLLEMTWPLVFLSLIESSQEPYHCSVEPFSLAIPSRVVRSCPGFVYTIGGAEQGHYLSFKAAPLVRVNSLRHSIVADPVVDKTLHDGSGCLIFGGDGHCPFGEHVSEDKDILSAIR